MRLQDAQVAFLAQEGKTRPLVPRPRKGTGPAATKSEPLQSPCPARRGATEERKSAEALVPPTRTSQSQRGRQRGSRVILLKAGTKPNTKATQEADGVGGRLGTDSTGPFK